MKSEVIKMNRDIDIREHAVIIKFDHGHEEVKSETTEIGKNVLGENMRIVLHKDANGELVRVKVQNL